MGRKRRWTSSRYSYYSDRHNRKFLSPDEEALMTQPDQDAVASWTEPEGLTPRGTIVVIPGRGERPGVYERFGRRISGDAYRVHAVASPAEDAALAEEQVL